MITFFVQGDPKGQPRAKAFHRNGFTRVYDPATAEGWKSQIAIAAKPFAQFVPLSGPVLANLEFYFARPKSHYRTGKNAGELKPNAPQWHTTKPDRDNLDKAVLDALSQLGMWNDDCQVCAGTIQKKYIPTPHSRPGVNVSLWLIEPQ